MVFMVLGLIFAMAAPVCLIAAGGCALFLSRKAFFWWRGFVLCILAVILCALISAYTEPVEIPDSIKPQFAEALGKTGLPVTVDDVTDWKSLSDYAYGKRYEASLRNKKKNVRYKLLIYERDGQIASIYDITGDRTLVYGVAEEPDGLPESTSVDVSGKVDLSVPYEQIYRDFNKSYSEAEALYCRNRYRVKAKVEALPEDGMTVTFAQWIGGTEKVMLTGEFWEVRAGDLEHITPGSVVTFTGVCTGQTSFEDCELN